MNNSGFSVGDRLKVKGLESKPEYNGCEGVVIGDMIEEKQRYPVKIEINNKYQSLLLKPDNIIKIESKLTESKIESKLTESKIESKLTESKIESIARQYCDININHPDSYWDYNNYSITWSLPNEYRILRKIGRGKYSEVYEGCFNSLQNNTEKKTKRVCIKSLKPIPINYIKKEIKILKLLKGGPNIIELLDVVQDPLSHTKSIIFEYIENTDYKKLWPILTDYDVRYYLYQLLETLNYCHSKGIMHRDIKPHNILIDHNTKILKLIDWGFADFYRPKKQYQVRVACRFYKGPELLLNMTMYDYSLDLWQIGCLFAGIIFQKEPFFNGNDNAQILIKIAQILGGKGLINYIKKYNLEFDKTLERIFGELPKTDWNMFVNHNTKKYIHHDSLDLIDKLLVYDHNKRLTAREAMKHKYFKQIRESHEKQKNQSIHDDDEKQTK